MFFISDIEDVPVDIIIGFVFAIFLLNLSQSFQKKLPYRMGNLIFLINQLQFHQMVC